MIRRFSSVRALADHVRRNLTQVDRVTFDVFDTLVIRRVHQPDAIKMATARFLARRMVAQGRPGWPAERIQRMRDRVERLHRRRNGRQHPDHEACYPEFMADVMRILFKGDDPAAHLEETTRYELQMESAFLVARADFVTLLRDLKAAGKKVAAISDMYLPATHIARLLDGVGYTGLVDEVVSSADTCRAKASGAAWPLLAERWKTEPARWWHVGDHPHSDGAQPAAFGLTALVLRDPGELQRKRMSESLASMTRPRPLWRGRLAQQWMLPLEAENVPRPELYRLGYTVLAPLLCAFIQNAAEQCRARGIKQVYFFSREGRLLQALWDRIIPVLHSGEELPQTRYLQVSRRALAGAAFAHQDLNLENARIAFLPASNRDFEDFCRVFGLDAAPFAPLLSRAGLQADTPISRWHEGWHPSHQDKFARLVADPAFQAEVRRQQASASEALQHYLASLGFFTQDRVAVLDIGWLGSIQRFLDQAIAHRPDRPALHGYLFAAAPGYPFPHRPDNTLDGCFFDHRRFDFAGSFVLTVRDIFEEATRAAEPGLLAYGPPDADENRLRFRTPPDEREQQQSAYFAPLQQGILDAAERFAPVAAVLGYGMADWKPWLNALAVEHLAFPRVREVKALTFRHHQDDLAHGRIPVARARRAMRRLWTEPLWKHRWWPGLRSWYFLKHAIYWLRQ